jgi:uncharacterized membrane protein YcaP (DUF421 family)
LTLFDLAKKGKAGPESAMETLEWMFGGDIPVEPLRMQVALRAVVVYVIGLAVVRTGKSRLVGRVSGLDILVGFILGSLLSRGITGHAALSTTAASSVALVAIHWLLTLLSTRWHAFGNLAKGHAVPLILDGRALEANLSATHISPHDLAEALRLHGICDMTQVAAAYKERNGDISVIKKTAA